MNKIQLEAWTPIISYSGSATVRLREKILSMRKTYKDKERHQKDIVKESHSHIINRETELVTAGLRKRYYNIGYK